MAIDDERVGERLLSIEQIAQRVKELGQQIGNDYRGRDLVLIGVLTGSVVFLSDLIRSIPGNLEVDFVAAASYGAVTHSSGVVRILKDLSHPILSKDALIVEDIVDTGLTLAYLIDRVASHQPASLATCVLLNKSARRRVPVDLNYVGFELPDRFVVGYGLDYAGRYRNLPSIHVYNLEESSGIECRRPSAD
ncbi:MAG: hypoxanthine phosphoribosyltransferase [Armatimonadetes bacterium]|nr:hypoxanthine phosphoribosyltransferase [Armatimonadota bacterium]